MQVFAAGDLVVEQQQLGGLPQGVRLPASAALSRPAVWKELVARPEREGALHCSQPTPRPPSRSARSCQRRVAALGAKVYLAFTQSSHSHR
jgi:hypothetical protein